jgi:hypothetical protein
MLYATVERCPVIGGSLKSFDAGDALKSRGVIKVVEVERIMGIYHTIGVAVIAILIGMRPRLAKDLRSNGTPKAMKILIQQIMKIVCGNLPTKMACPIKMLDPLIH